MDDFLFKALPLRVLFERGGRRRVGDEMAAIGRARDGSLYARTPCVG